ncbi:MAG: D-glucuronyl C5-epimerase family protein [Candidatus Omnitrophota bacterium]|nr:D-glucuronyl C5-epimerase family protein [Candidatus Omnitrophota bacterium]
MFIKSAAFLRISLDYPLEINEELTEKRGLYYYLDFKRVNTDYILPNVSFDGTGIPRFNYAIVPSPNNKNGFIYSITYICWYALGCLQEYLDKGDNRGKDSFIRQADWLMEHASVENGVVSWPIEFPWNVYGTWLPVPRVSSMDQGLAISVLIRAYLLTSQDRYLKTAKQGEQFYDIPLGQGGFNHRLKNGSVFYEMYPSNDPSLILDGHIFSMMGLYDLHSVIPDSMTKIRFDAGLEAVVSNIDYWNYRDIWSWFGRFYLSNPMYHKINACWLRVLAGISGDNNLAHLADRWMRAYRNKIIGGYLKFRIPLSSRLFLLSRGLLGSDMRKAGV